MRRKKFKRLNRKEFTVLALFFAFIAVYEFLVVRFSMGTEMANWRYYFFMAIVAISFIVFVCINRKKLRKISGKEVGYTIATAALFLVVSFFQSKSSNIEMPFRVLVQISLFLLPCLLACIICNTLPIESLTTLAKGVLFLSIVFYFLEPKHTIMQFLNLDNYLKIDLLNSKSFTESSAFFEVFLQLFLMFNYMEKKINTEDSSIKKFTIISLIFTILSFKRLGVVFALVIFIFRNKIKYDKKSKLNWLILSVIFTGLTVFYTYLMQGRLFGTYDQIFSLTSGRNWILSLWERHNYISYGYGTSILVTGKYLEMDLVEIFLEMGVVCLFIFSVSWFKYTKNNAYANMIMTYAFLNLLTSSSLPWSIGHIIMFVNIITIATVTENNRKNNISVRLDDKERQLLKEQ